MLGKSACVIVCWLSPDNQSPKQPMSKFQITLLFRPLRYVGRWWSTELYRHGAKHFDGYLKYGKTQT